MTRLWLIMPVATASVTLVGCATTTEGARDGQPIVQTTGEVIAADPKLKGGRANALRLARELLTPRITTDAEPQS